MRAIILVASLSVLLLSACVHNRGYGHWERHDHPVHSKKYDKKHHKEREKARKKALKQIEKNNKKYNKARRKHRDW